MEQRELMYEITSYKTSHVPSALKTAQKCLIYKHQLIASVKRQTV